jgi:hypothetical protein
MYYRSKKTSLKLKESNGIHYRVRLDSKTVVVITSMDSYLEWRKKYPNATIIH